LTKAFVKFREMQLGQGGILKGQDLASTFSFLRPNDLVWNYVVGNYLKGETPPPFDLLYWNSDSTNLPGPMYAWYLRNTYFENNLVKPGKCTVAARRSTCARWTCRCTSTARAKTTSCPLAAPTRRHSTCRARSGL
jgi:polyhydroxyalkanoate synthase